MTTTCSGCAGQGSRWYGSGSGWRGGMAPACMRRDVCDLCWGSGDESQPSEDLRKRDEQREMEIDRRALKALTDVAGAQFSTCKPAVLELADVLEATTRGRKPRSQWRDGIALALAKHLRRAVTTPAERDDAKEG